MKTFTTPRGSGDLVGLRQRLVDAGFDVLNVGGDKAHTYVYLADSEQKHPGAIIQAWMDAAAGVPPKPQAPPAPPAATPKTKAQSIQKAQTPTGELSRGHVTAHSRIAICCFLANQADLKFPLRTVLHSYLEADEVFLYAGDVPTEEAWHEAVTSLSSPSHVSVQSLPFVIQKPQDICAAKNAAIDKTVSNTQCDYILVIDPDVALIPGWANLLSKVDARHKVSPFRLFIQNAILFVDIGLMPFGTVLMPKDYPGRLVWDGSYFSPNDPAVGAPLALHLGYMTIDLLRRHLARNRNVWAGHIGGGVNTLEEYATLDDYRLAREVLLDLRDGRRPSIHMLNYGKTPRQLALITDPVKDSPGRDLVPWIITLIDELDAKSDLDTVRRIILDIGPGLLK